MTKLPNNLSEEEFFLLHVHEYLGYDISESNKTLFDQILEKEEFKKKIDTYKKKQGVLQIYLQEQAITQKEQAELVNKMRPQEASEALEKVKIDALSIREQKMKNFRIFSIITFPVLVFFLLWKTFAPPPPPEFDPLQSLAYETIAMYNKDSLAYLDFPSSNRQEIIEFLANNRKVHFEPLVFNFSQENSWREVGSSVIDYEIAKIVMVQYHQQETDENLYLYSYKGDIRYLPHDQPGSIGEFTYFSFGSDKINLIAWQSAPETVAILSGWLSVEDLAKIAQSGVSS